MKFISVVALLAPVVLAAPQARAESNWIGLIQENCPNMSEQCIAVAQKVHDPAYLDDAQVIQAALTCNKSYLDCIPNISENTEVSSSTPTQGELAKCLQQISPDHFKYFLDNDSAEIPIPRSQNCALRELHRVAHTELGPLAK